MSTISERSAYIEEAGLFFESLGMTRMAGRIMGYMMISDKEMISFDELTQVLKASKSSISTNVKACQATGFIKPITSPGDRKTYYMLSKEVSWVALFERRAMQLKLLNDLLKKALSMRPNPKDKSSQWLENAVEFYDWVIVEFPRMLEKWEELKKNEK